MTAKEETSLHRNVVALVGRLPAAAVVTEMPSGDLRTSWRLVVRRTNRDSGSRPTRTTVDTLPCGTWEPEVRRELLACGPGDQVEVVGSLRRRFWRSVHGLMSRFEVEADGARRVALTG